MDGYWQVAAILFLGLICWAIETGALIKKAGNGH